MKHRRMSAADKQRVFNAALAAIVEAARLGQRCPENGTHGVSSQITGALVRSGVARIEISSRNYRRVIFVKGPHAGLSTAADPSGNRPWKIIDASGTRVNGRRQVPKTGNEPSLARITAFDGDAA